ncbi:class I SAM-dependent methyltransferase [Actinoalloteichus hymeniacidonis]|nr:class I SAM-dependent methyltransferase [Actinoalloteichus hymeniacidonis]MBB5908210.1 ubiquinone/menaquinone biosynthesis C-methylase UbiE [Actinoalloteichus hymeniacidonis]
MSEVIDRLIVENTGSDHSSAEAAEAKRVVSTVYDLLASTWKLVEMWNWGYDDAQLHQEIEKRIPGFSRFGTDGFSEALYYYTLRQVPTELTDYHGKRILEVGSGIGGGLNFLSRVADGAELSGVDLSKTAVARANARHFRPNKLSYTNGDAEDIPFEDGTFDVVINLESCHNYPHLDKFFSEVSRVLKPGGHFSAVDLFNDQHLANFKQAQSTNAQLKWLSETDISPQVISAVNKRMVKGSYLQETFSKQKGPLLQQLISRPCWTAAFGALFSGDASTSPVAKWARKVGGLSSMDKAPIRIYRHNLATRVV